MTTNHNPVRAMATDLARMFGQDPSESPQDAAYDREAAETISTFIPDRHPVERADLANRATAALVDLIAYERSLA